MMRSVFAASLLALAGSALAQTAASGAITYVQTGSSYTYDIQLRNTGTTTVGTLWYAWIPGQDYLPIAPTATSGPAGWTFTQTTGAGFGYGLRWVAPAAGLLAAGASLGGFTFTTTTTPAELAGNAVFGAHPPVGTSFVYERPFAGTTTSGGFSQFVINPVPEPSTLAALLPALALLRRRHSAQRRSAASYAA